jgi:RNA polymerase sigma-70 factor (ECF subfamily)
MPNPEFVREELQRLIPPLLRRLKAGQAREECFRLLFKAYYSRVHNSFPAQRVSREDREDLTQEVFLRVYRSIEDCPEDVEGFERWLFTIARNVFLTWLQKSSRLKRRGLEVQPDSAGEGGFGETELREPHDSARGAALDRILVGERAELLHRAIREMPEQMRACVLMRVGQDRTYREIARLLGLAEGTVKAHLHRARMWLRTALGPYFEDFDL